MEFDDDQHNEELIIVVAYLVDDVPYEQIGSAQQMVQIIDSLYDETLDFNAKFDATMAIPQLYWDSQHSNICQSVVDRLVLMALRVVLVAMDGKH